MNFTFRILLHNFSFTEIFISVTTDVDEVINSSKNNNLLWIYFVLTARAR